MFKTEISTDLKGLTWRRQERRRFFAHCFLLIKLERSEIAFKKQLEENIATTRIHGLTGRNQPWISSQAAFVKKEIQCL